MIIKADISQIQTIVAFLQQHFIAQGYGYLHPEQLKTEILRGRVFVAIDPQMDGHIIGLRIGTDTVWNLVVHTAFRGQGVGRELMDYLPARTVRAKTQPIGHLSKAQRQAFQDSSFFYEAVGYFLWGIARARNFFQCAGGKVRFHKEGQRHIKVFRRKGTTLWDD